ncbi:MAG: hypothetical protein FJ398_19085 [Verrucomicrobia bacterium]|nr:hypothetical protein [Verrucomicrobiota bacterium]
MGDFIKTNSSAFVVPPGSDANTNDIRGIKAPVEILNAWAWLWWLAGALALAALCAWLWRRWRRKRREPAPVAVIPPHERALEKLREALGLMRQPRPFCTAVSDAVRVYLEERFEFRAPERTTEEFLDELQTSALLSFDQKQTLGEFLMRCDLVKFARYEPGEPELRQLYDAAVRLIEETQPPPPVAETGATATVKPNVSS